MKTLSPTTVGLFGTCGNSEWRAPFIETYEQLGIAFFNPKVPNWDPKLAEIEAWHLANDQLILFPVTNETLGTASLGEIGFSILSTLRWNDNRFVIVYIDPTLSDELKNEHNKDEVKGIENARKLLLAHLKELNHPNVYVVNSLKEMLDLSVVLFSSINTIRMAHSDGWREKMDPNFWHKAIQATSDKKFKMLKTIAA